MLPRRRTHVLVMAKAPVPGRVKTRLQVAYTPAEAALLASAAIADTMDAVWACGADRRIIAIDGEPGGWIEPRPGRTVEVVRQVDGPLGARLTAAWRAADGPGVQIGMDTPQVGADLLDQALTALLRPGINAVLGLASDGGWWGIGLRHPVRGLFDGIAMSRSDTGRRQLDRMRELGLRTTILPELADMDRPDDVANLARAHPHLRTAAVARTLGVGLNA